MFIFTAETQSARMSKSGCNITDALENRIETADAKLAANLTAVDN